MGRLLRWLTTDGTIAAVVVGTAVFAGSGLGGAALLSVFFVSGSLLTALSDRSPRPPASVWNNRRGRTASQVLANGLWPATGAVFMGSGYAAGWPLLLGSLAAAQADTWATEIGVHSPTPPRLITSGESVPVGTSGGVTVLGTTGGVIGAAVMGAMGWILGYGTTVAAAAFLAGVAGMVVDSLLGATVQAGYYCKACSTASESRVHRCGQRGRSVRGWRWIDNDVVNFAGTAVGALSAIAVWTLW